MANGTKLIDDVKLISDISLSLNEVVEEVPYFSKIFLALEDLKKADIADSSVFYDGSTWVYTTGDYSTIKVEAADTLIVKAKDISLGAGAWVRQYKELDPKWFGAVGNDPLKDTPAIQAALNIGSIVNLGTYNFVPFVINKSLKITQPGTILKGERQIDTTASVFSTEAILVNAIDSTVDGIIIRNATKVNQPTGYQNWGIGINAHRCTVSNCRVLDFQMCIGVLPTGEWYDNKITTNYCRVIGAGEGPQNTLSSLGEDRGHGIADFGGRTLIDGNTVQAANALYGFNGNGPRIAGSDYNDCCLGIVSEALPGYGDESGPDNSSGSIVTNNHVVPSEDGKGRFRRCYSLEGMSNGIFTGNFGRGWTWNGLWIIGSASHSIIDGNVFICDTPDSDKSGAAWAPFKSGILVYSLNKVVLVNLIISNNNIFARTAHSHGIAIYAADAQPGHITFANNRCFAERPMGPCSAYFAYSGGNSVFFNNNASVGAWSSGYYTDTCSKISISGGSIDGTYAAAIVGARITNMTINDVSIANCVRGIDVFVGAYSIRNVRFQEITYESLVASSLSTTINFENNRYVYGTVSTYIDNVNFETIRGNTGFPVFEGSLVTSSQTILNKDAISFDVPLTYLRPGDNVRPLFSVPLKGCVLLASVKTVGIATVSVMNWSGADVTLDSGSIKIRMER